MRYINNTLITIKKKHQHNIELTQPFHSSPLSLVEEEKNFLSKQVLIKLIKSTMLQLRMKGLKRTIYYLFLLKGTTPPTLTYRVRSLLM
jgi:hypothetical protein